MAMGVHGGSTGRGRGRRRSSRRAPMAEINVTPLVDVMLVLLIIFMVTAPLLNTGVPINLPESRAEPLEQPDEPIEIAVDDGGAVFVNGDEVAMAALPNALEEIAAQQNPEKPKQIMLRGDTALSYGKMMQVMGELNRAGLNNVGLVTQSSPAVQSKEE